jgi:hypothetical protein
MLIKITKECMNNNYLVRLFLIIAFSLTVTGCATIFSSSKQTISVQTIAKGKTVSGAQCQLTNLKGTYFLISPGTVTVNKANDPLIIKCEKDGFEPGIVNAVSSVGGAAMANILFLGLGTVIGGAIDAGSGAAFNYADLVTVALGEVQNIDNEGKPVIVPEKQ